MKSKKTLSNDDSSRNYLSVKESLLDRIVTTQILAKPLTFSGSNGDAESRKIRIPFLLICCCLQDTPESPCNCNKILPIIIWLSKLDIISAVKSHDTNHVDGAYLYEINSNSDIIVEHEQLIKADELRNFDFLPPKNANMSRGVAMDSLTAFCQRSGVMVGMAESMLSHNPALRYNSEFMGALHDLKEFRSKVCIQG